MRPAPILILFCLLASSAFGDDPPATDLLGVYFEQEAVTTAIDTDTQTPFFAYVVLTNPSGGNVEALEYSFSVTVPPGMEGQIYQLASMSCGPSSCSPQDGTTPLGGDHVFGFAIATPVQPATVVHTWMYYVISPMSLEFRLGPSSDGNMIYQAEGELIPMHPVTGDPDLPLAFVDVSEPTATRPSTFGTLKALYR